MDTDSDGQISVAELIAWVKKNSEQVGRIARLEIGGWFTLGATGPSVLLVFSGATPRREADRAQLVVHI